LRINLDKQITKLYALMIEKKKEAEHSDAFMDDELKKSLEEDVEAIQQAISCFRSLQTRYGDTIRID
jgi:hypothetical protein